MVKVLKRIVDKIDGDSSLAFAVHQRCLKRVSDLRVNDGGQVCDQASLLDKEPAVVVYVLQVASALDLIDEVLQVFEVGGLCRGHRWVLILATRQGSPVCLKVLLEMAQLLALLNLVAVLVRG